MMLLAAARDLMLVFLGVELMSLSVYVLAAVNRRSARGAEAAIKYFLLGAFSTGFMLYGMALLFGATGSIKLVDIAAWNAANPTGNTLFVVGIGMLLVGFVFKVAAAPFHLWTPDVYDGSPLPVTAFMAAVVKTAAFAMFARVFYEALGGAVERWHPVLWWLAALTMVVGNVFALAQKNLTRLIAYSSIAHAGYLLVALLGYSQASATAIVFYLVAYTLTTMGTFAVFVSVNGGRDQSPTMADVDGALAFPSISGGCHGRLHAVVPWAATLWRYGFLRQVVRVASRPANQRTANRAGGHFGAKQRGVGRLLPEGGFCDVYEAASGTHRHSGSTNAYGRCTKSRSR